MMIHALSVNVYRNNTIGDCTNGGLSSRFDTILVAMPEGNHVFDPDKMIPLNLCVIERICHRDCEHVRLVPATVDESGNVVKRPGWWMFGGNIARTSDSRFYEQTLYALDIHDRRE